jgi:hypothetical protein
VETTQLSLGRRVYREAYRPAAGSGRGSVFVGQLYFVPVGIEEIQGMMDNLPGSVARLVRPTTEAYHAALASRSETGNPSFPPSWCRESSGPARS